MKRKAPKSPKSPKTAKATKTKAAPQVASPPQNLHAARTEVTLLEATIWTDPKLARTAMLAFAAANGAPLMLATASADPTQFGEVYKGGPAGKLAEEALAKYADAVELVARFKAAELGSDAVLKAESAVGDRIALQRNLLQAKLADVNQKHVALGGGSWQQLLDSTKGTPQAA